MSKIKPDFLKDTNEVRFTLYGKFNITIPVDDWNFMCEKRWFSNSPTKHEVETEFGVCGARSASDNDEANEIVLNTIKAYKRILQHDEEDDGRISLNSSSRLVAKMDKNGKIYFVEC